MFLMGYVSYVYELLPGFVANGVSIFISEKVLSAKKQEEPA